MKKWVFISLSLVIFLCSSCTVNKAVQSSSSPLSTDEEGPGRTKTERQAAKAQQKAAKENISQASVPEKKQEVNKPAKEEKKKSKKQPEIATAAPVTSAVPAASLPPSNDSLFVTLERTSCFGHCPSYKIEIYLRGYVVYHGYNYVDRTGDYYSKMNKEQLKQLFDFAKEIKYYNFKDSYVNPSLTDVPTTITSMNIKGNKKTIINGHSETPSELIFFEKLIDDMFKDTEWKPIKK